MEENQVVYRIQRNSDDEIQISLREYKGRAYVDFRVWFQPDNGGELKPTKKGLTISLDHLGELQKGLREAQKCAEKAALQVTTGPVK